MVRFTQPQADEMSESGEPWKPKAGSPLSIVGTVIDRQEVTRQDGTEVEFVKVTDNDQNIWVVWCGSTMLKQLVKRDDPQVGDTWGVEYQGTKPIGNGRSMDQYGGFHRPAKASGVVAKKSGKKAYDIASGPDMADTGANDDEPF